MVYCHINLCCMLMLAIKRSADMKPLDQSGLWKIASLLLDDPPDLSISIVRGLKNLFLISIKKKHRRIEGTLLLPFSPVGCKQLRKNN